MIVPQVPREDFQLVLNLFPVPPLEPDPGAVVVQDVPLSHWPHAKGDRGAGTLASKPQRWCLRGYQTALPV